MTESNLSKARIRGESGRLLDLPLELREAIAHLKVQVIEHVKTMDESNEDAWPAIVKIVRAAGLDKEALCRELSCAWSTILRWEAGATVPGPFARKSIKKKFIEMLAQSPSAREGFAVRIERSSAEEPAAIYPVRGQDARIRVRRRKSTTGR